MIKTKSSFLWSVIPILGLFLICLSWTNPTFAATAEPSIGGQALDFAKGTSYARIAVLLTILSLIPAIVIATTAFTRIIIVLSAVRMGLGMQETPPNIVLITLALFLSAFVMMPTANEIKSSALDPYLAGTISSSEFLDRSSKPLEQFMLDHTREQDLAAVEAMAQTEKDEKKSLAPANPAKATLESPGLMVVIPAFMLSELRVAFQMAFMVLLPFLLVDLIVSVTLMALGMMMVPPTTISLPIKILMFVLVDGWIVLARSLVGSFGV